MLRQDPVYQIRKIMRKKEKKEKEEEDKDEEEWRIYQYLKI